MTDTATAPAISVTPEALREKYAEIVSVDEQLAAASGSTNLGKQALSNTLMNERSEVWNGLTTALVERLNEAQSQGIENLVATYAAVEKTLRDNFREAVDKFLTETVEKQQAENPTQEVSEEEIENLTKHGRELREQYNALRQILEMFGHNVEDIPVPKRLSGSRGKRGPRVMSKYDYFVDGQPRTESQNSLSSIANTVCTDLGWKTKDLRNFLVEQGIDIQNPPAEWEVTLPAPNNKKIRGVKRTEEDVYEGSDDDDDDESEDDENE